VNVLLDTHVLLWWKAGGSKLSRAATRTLAGAERLHVSPIVFWEVATLVVKGRVELDRDVFEWVADVLGDERIESAPLSGRAAANAALLGTRGFMGDPADRLIYATAAELVLPLVSKDGRIRSFAERHKDVRVIW